MGGGYGYGMGSGYGMGMGYGLAIIRILAHYIYWQVHGQE